MIRKLLLTIFSIIILAALDTDKDLQEVKRDIPANYYIRPIPQGQLDGMEMTDAEKSAYQNPAYRN